MFVTALLVMSPMIIFMTGVGSIIAIPHLKKGIKYSYDCATKGKHNPEHDTYSVIIGSMIHNSDEWKFDRDTAIWPRPEKGKYQIMINYDRKEKKVEVSMMRDGGKFHTVEGYWGAMLRDCMTEQAAKVQTINVYKQLFPNGAPLLLTKVKN